MGIVVQKYGGSSVADATGIKRVAQRIVNTRKAGNDVVVVVSAMGDTTDELRDLAEQVTPLPPPRELDMLLTAGERISMALRRHGDRPARPQGAVVHRLPGRRDHRLRARQGEDHRHHARPDRERHPGPGRSRSWPASRASPRTPRTSPRSAAARPTPPRSRWPRRSAPRSARSTPTSTASSPPTRGSCPTARKLDRLSTEEMLEMAASGAKILHLRCVEYARRYNMPVHVRSSFSQKEGTWIVPAAEGEEMEQAIIAGVAHDRSEAKITVVGVPDKVGEAARIFEALAATEVNIDMVVQNISAAATGLTDISFTLPREDGQSADGRARPDPGGGRLRQAPLRRPDRQGVADRCRHALAPRHHRQVLLRARLRRRQHRDDLHLRDPDLGDRRRGPDRGGRALHPLGVRPGRLRGRGGRLRRDRER